MRRSAFTLIELLVGMTVVAILVALIAAGLARSLRSAKAARCVADLRSIGQTFVAYAADNDGRLPQSSHQGPKLAWTTIARWTLPANVFRSPLDDADRTCSYAINDLLTVTPFGAESSNFSRLQNIPAPSETMLLGILSRGQLNSDHFHFASEGWTADTFAADVWVEITGHAGLYLFVDGHVAQVAWHDLQKNLADPHSRFVSPDGNP